MGANPHQGTSANRQMPMVPKISVPSPFMRSLASAADRTKISFCEPLYSLESLANGVLTSMRRQLNPGISDLFNRISHFATGFRLYRFDALKISYIPSCSYTTSGVVGYGFGAAGGDGLTDPIQSLYLESAQMHPLYEPGTCTLDCSDAIRGDKLYPVSSSDFKELKVGSSEVKGGFSLSTMVGLAVQSLFCTVANYSSTLGASRLGYFVAEGVLTLAHLKRPDPVYTSSVADDFEGQSIPPSVGNLIQVGSLRTGDPSLIPPTNTNPGYVQTVDEDDDNPPVNQTSENKPPSINFPELDGSVLRRRFPHIRQEDIGHVSLGSHRYAVGSLANMVGGPETPTDAYTVDSSFLAAVPLPDELVQGTETTYRARGLVTAYTGHVSPIAVPKTDEKSLSPRRAPYGVRLGLKPFNPFKHKLINGDWCYQMSPKGPWLRHADRVLEYAPLATGDVSVGVYAFAPSGLVTNLASGVVNAVSETVVNAVVDFTGMVNEWIGTTLTPLDGCLASAWNTVCGWFGF